MTQETMPAPVTPFPVNREQARVVLDESRVELMKQQLMPEGTTDGELMLFAEVCRKWNLDPFLRQIYAAKPSSGRLQFAATIDGLRLIASRTGEYRGQTSAQWCGHDGRWRDVWLEEDPPAAARVGVYREGFIEPAWGTATFTAYAQRTSNGRLIGQWESNPSNQLAKCAEALALRKAFPADMSGLYAEEEMASVDRPRAGSQTRRPVPRQSTPRAHAAARQEPPLTREEYQRFWEEAREAGVTIDQVKDLLGGRMLNVATREEALRCWAEFGNPPVDVVTGEVIEGEPAPEGGE